MKDGYVPPEDIGKFVCSAEKAHRERVQYVPGSSRLRNPNAGMLMSCIASDLYFFYFSEYV